jgi:hypothetical protein
VQGERVELKTAPGPAGGTVVVEASKGPLLFTVKKGDMARTEGPKSEAELEYTDPKTGERTTAYISDEKAKRFLCDRPTSIVTYLNPMLMFPSKPRFRGQGYVDEAGAQYICCAGPNGAKQPGQCPYRPRYAQRDTFNEREYHSVLERDRDTGRFFLQGYGVCLRLEERKGNNGEGIPKHIVRAKGVDKLFALEPGPSPSLWMDDVGDSEGNALEFQMQLSAEQAEILATGGVNAMHIRAIPPHPHYVPWRIAHVRHKVEAIAQTWAEVRARGPRAETSRAEAAPRRKRTPFALVRCGWELTCARALAPRPAFRGSLAPPPARAQLFVAKEYANIISADKPFSPFTVVDRAKVAKLLVGVDYTAGGKADASNVRFVCEKCYDSYVVAMPPTAGKVDASLLK